jgi:hypothetical protein
MSKEGDGAREDVGCGRLCDVGCRVVTGGLGGRVRGGETRVGGLGVGMEGCDEEGKVGGGLLV